MGVGLAVQILRTDLEAGSRIGFGDATAQHAADQGIRGMIGLEVNARLRGRAVGVTQPAVLDQQVFRADDADALPVVGVAVDAPDRHLPVGGVLRARAEVDAVASRLFDREVLDQHVAASEEGHPMPPFRLFIGGGLIILFVHADVGGLAAIRPVAPEHDVFAFAEREQAVALGPEGAFQRHQFGSRLEYDFLVAHAGQRPRDPGRRLPVENQPLDFRVDGLLQVRRGIRGIESPPRHAGFLPFAGQHLPDQFRFGMTLRAWAKLSAS